MGGLELYAELTPAQVSAWAAVQRHSPGWGNYSLKNPRSTDDAVAKVQQGEWRLKISHIGHVMVGAHWLKLMHYAEGYSWVDGIIFPDFRGKRHHGLLMDEWNQFARWARDQGYPELLCASFVDNRAAHDWITELCGFYVVGTRSEASQRPDGTWDAVVVYASDGQDVHEARKRAETVYERGEWA